MRQVTREKTTKWLWQFRILDNEAYLPFSATVAEFRISNGRIRKPFSHPRFNTTFAPHYIHHTEIQGTINIFRNAVVFSSLFKIVLLRSFVFCRASLLRVSLVFLPLLTSSEVFSNHIERISCRGLSHTSTSSEAHLVRLVCACMAAQERKRELLYCMPLYKQTSIFADVWASSDFMNFTLFLIDLIPIFIGLFSNLLIYALLHWVKFAYPRKKLFCRCCALAPEQW